MTNNIESKLAFDRIREMLVEGCSNTLSQKMAREMSFLNDYARLQTELDLTEELRQILLMENAFPSEDFIDLSDSLLRLRIANTALSKPDLFDLKRSLQTISDLLRFLLVDDSHYPQLRTLAETVEFDSTLLKQLNRLIDDKGEFFDDASDHLLEIRRLLVRKSAEIDTQISRSLSRAKAEGWAPENAEASIRNGRPVIPMKTTHRRKIRGIVHDESATRQTAYLEPSEVVELNNELRELQLDEHHEEMRILLQVSDRIRTQLTQLVDAYWFLARIDFIRSKARLAITLHCVRPIVLPKIKIDWLDAAHPLLYIGDARRSVVPFSLSLDENSRILVVSGPNSGGKSVLLKAVGLIQYMLQCGLLVPCRETSEFGMFDRVFIDIGDQQSIDDDLSTYTSHLQNMKQLLQVADSHTLFLLDELGGGTEPRSGCAIAEAVLETLMEKGSMGVVTTHFADLKNLADKYDSIVNGAMLFDSNTMRPRYQLSVGVPGSSFAFEIAANIGFPQDVLDSAATKVGSQMLDYEHQLQQLELDRREVERQRTELEVADNFLAEVTQKYQTLSEKLETRRHDILSQARSEARQIIRDANRTIEQTISDIRKSQADRQQTLSARKKLQEQLQTLETEQQREDERLQQATAPGKSSSIESVGSAALSQSSAVADSIVLDDNQGSICIGSIVRIDGQDTFAQVVQIKGKKAVVESNSVRMTIPLERLGLTKKLAIPQEKYSQKNSRFQSIFDDINDKRKTFNPTLDIRGQRVEEALQNVQHHLDDALLLGEKELRILHGKGYGILKQEVRRFLQSHSEVASLRSEMLELGGDGITIVQMK